MLVLCCFSGIASLSVCDFLCSDTSSLPMRPLCMQLIRAMTVDGTIPAKESRSADYACQPVLRGKCCLSTCIESLKKSTTTKGVIVPGAHVMPACMRMYTCVCGDPSVSWGCWIKKPQQRGGGGGVQCSLLVLCAESARGGLHGRPACVLCVVTLQCGSDNNNLGWLWSR